MQVVENLKLTNAIIAFSQKNFRCDDLKKFNTTITNAKLLTERKRYYVSNYIENYIDIVNAVKQIRLSPQNYDRFYDNELIECKRKLATKRFNKLNEDGV